MAYDVPAWRTIVELLLITLEVNAPELLEYVSNGIPAGQDEGKIESLRFAELKRRIRTPVDILEYGTEHSISRFIIGIRQCP